MPLLTLVGKFHFTVFSPNFGKQNPFYCFYCGSANFTGRSWLNFCTFCFDNIFLHSIVDFGGSCPHSHAHLCHHAFGHFSNFRSQLSQPPPPNSAPIGTRIPITPNSPNRPQNNRVPQHPERAQLRLMEF